MLYFELQSGFLTDAGILFLMLSSFFVLLSGLFHIGFKWMHTLLATLFFLCFSIGGIVLINPMMISGIIPDKLIPIQWAIPIFSLFLLVSKKSNHLYFSKETRPILRNFYFWEWMMFFAQISWLLVAAASLLFM
jgi:hypothetical membrane protein